MHHPPRKQPGVEFGGRPWPGPSAHDDERSDAARIAHGERQASRAAPVVTDHRNTRQIEVTDEADKIGDMAIERVRMLARRLFGKAEPDHIRE